jgi:integrase
VRLVYRSMPAGIVAYAQWRDSTRTQRMKKVGVVWAEPYGERWRNRRGTKPEEALSIEDAFTRAKDVIAAHEATLTATVDNSGATFKDVAWAWHAKGRDVTGWAPSTVEDRGHTIRHHLEPAFGSRPVTSITRADVRKWWDGLHNVKREGGRLSDRNANKLLTELRAILNWAAEDYGLADNAAAGIPKHPERTSERPAFYSPAEVTKLVSAAATDQDRLAFQVAAYAGLRRGEVVSLRWRNVDFKRSNLHVDESVSAGQDSTPKSGKGRAVPLAKTLADALKAVRPADATDDDLVFIGKEPGAKMDGSALRRRFEAARIKAKLPPLRFHDLRHTFGSLAVDAGASLVQVQAWMGHSAIQTTMRYLHTKSRTEDAKLLDRAFAGPSQRRTRRR